MKGCALLVASLLILVLLVVPNSTVSARRIGRLSSNHEHRHSTWPKAKVEHAMNPNFYRERRPPTRPGRADMGQSAGSSLPDCSHACGSCSPCRLVMVRFVCASVQEPETCPMAYKCTCNSKSYPVP